MTTLDTLNPGSTRPSAGERTVGITEIYPVSPEFDVLSRKLIGQAMDYLYDTSGTPPVPVSAIIQKNAYSRPEENQREYFVRRLTAMLDVDVDEALHRFEVTASEREGSDVVPLMPWMKGSLGLPKSDEPAYVPGSILRNARLNFAHQAPLMLHELELPITATDPETGESESRAARFLWFSAD